MGRDPEHDWESGSEGRGRAVLIGTAALLIWLVTLWLMFGDVL